ncbi:multidrug effflux MFS transporter [Albidovulum sp.]
MTTHEPPAGAAGATRSGNISTTEFVAIMALLFAMTAFSIDAMLPALPEIAHDLSPEAPNRAQLIITSFVLGMGLGTFVTGPLSDSLGRRTVIAGGVTLYACGALLAWLAPSLELVLAARLIQGLGVAGPRVAGMALVRDLHSGRQMARITSFIMMIFTLVPAIAPLIGAQIIRGYGWRGIFLAFLVFAAIALMWFLLRQRETLGRDDRRPFAARAILAACREVLANRTVALVMLAQTMIFAALFSTLASSQQIFDAYFGRGAEFPYWFALVAVCAGTSSFVNASLVMRVGMRALTTVTFAAQGTFSGLLWLLLASGAIAGPGAFPLYLLWMISVFFMLGLTLGNLMAIAMEPMGHIAGTAASLITAIATVLSVAIAIPVGFAFDNTPLPLVGSVFVLVAASFAIVLSLPRSR